MVLEISIDRRSSCKFSSLKLLFVGSDKNSMKFKKKEIVDDTLYLAIPLETRR